MMRSFEERMAEINRRSEKIKRERKDLRKRILLACIPLALCIGLWSVLLLGQGGPAGDMILLPENVPQDDGSAMGTLNGSGSGIAYTELTLSANSALLDDEEKIVTDAAVVKTVYEIFTEQYRFGISSESTTEDQESITETKESADGAYETPKDNYAPVMEYTFTFTTPGGAEAIFTLRGNQITDKASGESHILTQEQLSRLKDTLGI